MSDGIMGWNVIDSILAQNSVLNIQLIYFTKIISCTLSRFRQLYLTLTIIFFSSHETQKGHTAYLICLMGTENPKCVNYIVISYNNSQKNICVKNSNAGTQQDQLFLIKLSHLNGRKDTGSTIDDSIILELININISWVFIP